MNIENNISAKNGTPDTQGLFESHVLFRSLWGNFSFAYFKDILFTLTCNEGFVGVMGYIFNHRATEIVLHMIELKHYKSDNLI